MKLSNLLQKVLSAFFFFITMCQSLAQTPTLSIADNAGMYSTSVPPGTGIYYYVTPAKAGCLYNWVTTNSVNRTDGDKVSGNSLNYFIIWKNINANATVTATSYNCNSAGDNGVSGTYSVPIRYIGSVGPISLNGSSANPQSLGCGAQAVTLSVGVVENAANYKWTLPSGWVINGGQNTRFLQATSSSGTNGTIYVTATRSDAPDASTIGSMIISRPTLGAAAITGSTQGCYNQSGIYSLVNLTSGISTIWSATSPLTLASSSATDATFNYGSSDGNSTITAQITDACNNTATRTLSVGVGSPNISTINYDGSPNTGPMPATSGSTHTIQAISSNSSTASYNFSVYRNSGDINVSLVSSTSDGNNRIYVSGTIGSSNITITGSNVCSNRSGTLIVYIPSGYRVAANPTSSSVKIAFTDTKTKEALPDKLELVSEKTAGTVRSVNVQELFDKSAFQDGTSVVFDIKDLPRGIYYLKVSNPRQEKAKQTETVRLVFD